MTEQIISKKCSKCKETKPISEFYKRLDSRDGHRKACKACKLKYEKKYSRTRKGKTSHRKANIRYGKTEKCKITRKHYEKSEKGRKIRTDIIKRFKIRHPEQFKAIAAINHAIENGRLPRPDSLQCHYCPAQAKQYHHWHGYEPEHWLDVVPACIKCHGENRRNYP